VLNANAVNALRNRIRAEIDEGHSEAAQFALGLNGEIVATESFGTATGDSPLRHLLGDQDDGGNVAAAPPRRRERSN
jgi:hypothetical protein